MDAYKERSVTQARGMVAWRGLIADIHATQAAAGWEGRHFGPDEVRTFGVSLVGRPYVAPETGHTYWVERSRPVFSDGVEYIRYTVRTWEPGAPFVETVDALSASGEQPDAECARAMVHRAADLAGVRA